MYNTKFIKTTPGARLRPPTNIQQKPGNNAKDNQQKSELEQALPHKAGCIIHSETTVVSSLFPFPNQTPNQSPQSPKLKSLLPPPFFLNF